MDALCQHNHEAIQEIRETLRELVLMVSAMSSERDLLKQLVGDMNKSIVEKDTRIRELESLLLQLKK